MRRSAARCRMASRSPGRRRIVIRSRAGPLLDGLGGKSGAWESSNARIAIRASVDSDTCRWAATAANRRFSCGVGRAVIDGALAFAAPSFTARQPVLLQIADTSLSCHHSNTDPTTDLNPNFLLISDPPIRTYTLRELLGVCGESFAVFSAELSPGQCNAQVCSIEYTARSLIVLRFTCGMTMSGRLDSGKTMIRTNSPTIGFPYWRRGKTDSVVTKGMQHHVCGMSCQIPAKSGRWTSGIDRV